MNNEYFNIKDMDINCKFTFRILGVENPDNKTEAKFMLFESEDLDFDIAIGGKDLIGSFGSPYEDNKMVETEFLSVYYSTNVYEDGVRYFHHLKIIVNDNIMLEDINEVFDAIGKNYDERIGNINLYKLLIPLYIREFKIVSDLNVGLEEYMNELIKDYKD